MKPDTDEQRPNKKTTIPWRLLLLDFAGAALAALGFYRFISDRGGVFLIIFGLLLMMPLVFHILGLTGRNRP